MKTSQEKAALIEKLRDEVDQFQRIHGDIASEVRACHGDIPAELSAKLEESAARVTKAIQDLDAAVKS